jgi:thiol-disulfide isomerase/thioredoxin
MLSANFFIQAVFSFLFLFSGGPKEKFKVYFFLAPDCPISQQYTKEINRLNDQYKDMIDFSLVFEMEDTGKGGKEVSEFVQKYHMKPSVIFDKGQLLALQLKATITPETFLLNTTGEILYHGAIDNWYYALGKNRIDVTEHYLENAIMNIKENQPVRTPYAKATGCFIQFQ